MARRVVLGSVVSSLLKVAPVPVLVVPADSPTMSTGLTTAAERLATRLERNPERPELEDLRAAAADQLADPNASTTWKHRLGDRPLEALQRFEVNRPDLTRAISDVSYHLSALEI